MHYTSELLKGNTEAILLSLLCHQPMYGYQMVKEIERRSEGYFRFREGTLYPALHRLEKAGLVKAQWSKAQSGLQRRYYAITEKGVEVLRQMTQEWRNFTTAFNLVVQ